MLQPGSSIEGHLDTLDVILLLIDLSGRIVFMNRKGCRDLGCDGRKAVGKSWFETCFSRNDRDQARLIFARFLGGEEGGPVVMESGALNERGERINILWHLRLLTDVDGQAAAILLTGDDVTARKEAEAALGEFPVHLEALPGQGTGEHPSAVGPLKGQVARAQSNKGMLSESEEKFRGFSQVFHSLVDAMPDALLLIDREMKVLWANSAAEALGPVTDGGLVGEHCFTLLQDTSAPCNNCHALKTFQTGQSCSTQISSPGGRFWDVSTFPVTNLSGSVDKVILTYRDVTEKLTLQAEALRAGHLASLGELAAGVAHEINNPANGIINYAQILHDNPGNAESDRDMAVRIMKEGNRIASIVRSLLSFARDNEETKSPLSIARVLADALALTEVIIVKNGIHLAVDCPEDLPAVFGHGQQIQQVFLNVVNNARYALNMKHGGTSEEKRFGIRGERTTVHGVPMVRITFRDQGVGIPADLQEKVFHPFFSTKPSGEGTGLGLSISHSIIRDHGGRMSIESVEGEYTRVIIDLPAASEEDG